MELNKRVKIDLRDRAYAFDCDNIEMKTDAMKMIDEAVEVIVAAQEKGFEYHYTFDDNEYNRLMVEYGWQEHHKVVKLELRE